jgi:hypothetical protein
MPVDTILIKNAQYTHSQGSVCIHSNGQNKCRSTKIYRDAPPTDDTTCLDGLYSVFTAAAAAAAVVVVVVVVDDDDDDDVLGMCI